MQPQQQLLWDELITHPHPSLARPCDVRIALADPDATQHDQAYELAHSMATRLGVVVDIHVHDNRRRMLTASPTSLGFALRIHHMFLDCEPEVEQALAGFLLGQAEAREVLVRYIRVHRAAIARMSEEQLRTQGRFHDLDALCARVVSSVRALGYEPPEDLRITWGRRGRGSRSIRFGSYEFGQQLVRIHPALDQSWVPDYFVEYVVFHEVLHSVIAPIEDKTRRVIHTSEFLCMEKRFHDYDEAMAWEKQNLRRLLHGK